MFRDNLCQLRKLNGLSQEELAEKVNVSRQTLSKWESGESAPDLERAAALAEVFGVTLDDLVNYESTVEGLSPPPRGKHIFGVVTVGEKGQIVLPAAARKIFGIDPGDRLLVLGDETQGLALMRESVIFERLVKPFLDGDEHCGRSLQKRTNKPRRRTRRPGKRFSTLVCPLISWISNVQTETFSCSSRFLSGNSFMQAL